MVKERVSELRERFEGESASVDSVRALEELRTRFLGRKGPIQELMRSLRDASPEERPHLGKLINDLKVSVETTCSELMDQLMMREEGGRLRSERIDVTMPGRRPRLGRAHPVSAMLDEVCAIHRQMGFSVQDGPELESDYYNFEALNFPPDHPARDMHDTFYVGPALLLRTHTSNTQVRIMEKDPPPLRIAMPGRCFRNEDVTARSHIQFHQMEGLYVDRRVTFADLLATLNDLLGRLFFRGVETRFRASYFPFVEPGIEVDAACSCKGEGCSICKGTGWLEILGAGMVHPNVLKSGGLDPEEYSGYAWGLGIERLVMLRYGVQDIRLFFENDLRFLEQF